MAPKAPNYKLWFKMILGGAGIAVGGPALVMYISPTEEELFKRYNPDLQKRALESRYERQKEYDDFVTELKKSAKSDKNIWITQQIEAEKKEKLARQLASANAAAEHARMQQEEHEKIEQMRREAGLPPTR
ncbi:hypothetical protein PspLS_07825 [Pyricularia sp. CBS 133598]|nr:hypothetical protein PspLS_07825 [Pyricularia sp. CBS 133598]